MIENTTVTLPLKSFDEMREDSKRYRQFVAQISRCFDYVRDETADPNECDNCKSDIDCPDCEVYKNNPQYNEKLSVDVERLIRTTKEYALWGKDLDLDIDAITIEHRAERVTK